MTEADLRPVNVVWASPDPKDARRAEFGELTGGAPREAFTAQAHEARAFPTAARRQLLPDCACLVRLSGEWPEAPEFPSNELFPPRSRQPLSRPSSRSLSHQALQQRAWPAELVPSRNSPSSAPQLKPGKQETSNLEWIFSGSREPTATGSPP